VPPLSRLLVVAAAAGALGAAPRPPAGPDGAEARRAPAAARFASAGAIAHYVAGRRATLEGDAGRAADELRLAVGHDPDSPQLRVSLAAALALSARFPEAEAEARRAIELDRGGPAAADAHVLVARIRAAQKDPERAIAALRQAIRIESALAEDGGGADPQPWRFLAELYLEAGDDAAAARVLEDAAARLPGEALGFREMGRGLLDRREPAKAERALRRAVEIAPADAEARRLLARSLERQRRDADARDAWLGARRLAPDDDETLYALGALALRADDPRAAREWFARHLGAGSDSPDARLRVAFAWLDADRPAEALEAARAGIVEWGPDPRLEVAEGLALQDLRRWPDAAAAFGAVRADAGDVWVTARVSQAYALSRAGRHAEAERALEAPLAARPHEPRLVTMRAHVLERAGRGAQAVALLRRALDERTRAGDAGAVTPLVEALAESLGRLGRADEAIEPLRAALAARPRDTTLLYALGAAYDRAGQPDAAIAQMRALLAIEPDHAEALNFVGYSYADRGERLDEAERLVRRALDLRPRSGHILDSLGWVRFRKGELGGAIEALERADALAGPDAAILDHLGDAYRAALRPADAAGAYRRALKSLGEQDPAERVRLRSALERKLREVTAPQGGTAARERARVP
jgi:tetratricopeptide (TPR) repeat protein